MSKTHKGYKVQIWAIYGYYGAGKTLYMVALASTVKNSFEEIISNFRLRLDEVKYVNEISANTFKNVEKSSLICNSEAYKNIDCRKGMNKHVISLTHELQQLRKNGINYIYDCENPMTVDIRLRSITNRYIKAYGTFHDILKSQRTKNKLEGLNTVKSICSKKDFWKEYSIEDLRHLFLYQTFTQNNISSTPSNYFFIDGQKYYDLYDSEEKIHRGLKDYI